MIARIALAHAASIVIAFGLDALLGDIGGRFHPVALLGSLIARLERALRSRGHATRGGGVVLAALVVALAAGAALALSLFAWRFGIWWAVAVDAVIVWNALAVRTLADEGLAVARALAEDDLPLARTRIARIVGRDTDALGEEGIARACVESLGENVVDGVIAPLFWATLLGPAGAWAHKAASTLDSMVGYRDEHFGAIGWAGARLDDMLAFVPARLAVVLISISAGVLPGAHGGSAWRVGWRDRLEHASPNSAHGEAAFAGALRVRLGGESSYGGVLSVRPYLGAEFGPTGAGECRRAVRLVWMTGVVTCAVFAAAVLAVVAAAVTLGR